jgi:hypothetical protein
MMWALAPSLLIRRSFMRSIYLLEGERAPGALFRCPTGSAATPGRHHASLCNHIEIVPIATGLDHLALAGPSRLSMRLSLWGVAVFNISLVIFFFCSQWTSALRCSSILGLVNCRCVIRAMASCVLFSIGGATVAAAQCLFGCF